MDYVKQAKRVIELEVTELQRLLERIGEPFSDAVAALQRVLDAQRKIIVVGVGKSGNIGAKLAATLNSTGATSVVLDSQDALHGDLGVVSNGDAVLVLSHSGETGEITRILPHLRRFDVTLIALTGRTESILAKHCDIVLDANVEREACPLNLAPTSSSTVMLVLGDALAMVLLEARGFNVDDFAKLHPEGSLGRSLMLKVSDIMRPRDKIAIVAPTTTVTEALAKMTQMRGGAAVVVDPSGALSGIFTQGDFVRAFQANPSMGNEPVANHMTTEPITVASDRLAMEVLRLLKEHRIDDLIVLDAENHPVGMVDTQDLSRVKLL
jgi:arabinose-5-phosphate isomerase